jgi:hypothetical protein
VKNYDIWFNLAHPANLVVEAKDAKEANDIAEDILANMDKNELMDRIRNAVDYMGVEVVCVEKCVEP